MNNNFRIWDVAASDEKRNYPVFVLVLIVLFAASAIVSSFVLIKFDLKTAVMIILIIAACISVFAVIALSIYWIKTYKYFKALFYRSEICFARPIDLTKTVVGTEFHADCHYGDGKQYIYGIKYQLLSKGIIGDNDRYYIAGSKRIRSSGKDYYNRKEADVFFKSKVFAIKYDKQNGVALYFRARVACGFENTFEVDD